MECLPEGITKYIENYHIHVFDYHDYESYEMFQTELKQVFSFLKYALDKEKLKNFIAEHREEYHNVSIETCELIEALTNSKKLLTWKEYQDEEMGGVNMYNVFWELRQEGIEQGIEQGIKALIEIKYTL